MTLATTRFAHLLKYWRRHHLYLRWMYEYETSIYSLLNVERLACVVLWWVLTALHTLSEWFIHRFYLMGRVSIFPPPKRNTLSTTHLQTKTKWIINGVRQGLKWPISFFVGFVCLLRWYAKDPFVVFNVDWKWSNGMGQVARYQWKKHLFALYFNH